MHRSNQFINPRVQSLLKLLFGAMGLAYLVKIVFEIGPHDLLIHIKRMELGFGIIMLIALIEFVFHAWAWTYTFPAGSKPFHFLQLLRLWLGANAIKSLNPLGNVGGETYRLLVLGKFMGKKDASASMSLDIFSHVLMMIFLLVCAFAVSLVTFPWGTHVIMAAVLFLSALMGVCTWILKKKKSGLLFQTLAKWVNRIGPLSHLGLLEKSRELDGIIQNFFLLGKKPFTQLNLFHFLGKWVGFLEVWVIFLYLDAPIGGFDSFLIYSFLQLITILFFFIPSQIGVAEGGTYHLFTWVGLSPEVGVAMALIRRIRTLVWVFLGYALVAFGFAPKKSQL
jgi:uncharacterized protein (TIRG00374 family)